MSIHLQRLEPDQIVDLHRHWIRGVRRDTHETEELRAELQRAMADRDRVQELFEELSAGARQLLEWMIGRPGYRLPFSALDRGLDDLPIERFEVEALAHLLSRRGFLFRVEERDWLDYGQPVWLIPPELGRILASLMGREGRGNILAFSFASWLAAQPKAFLVSALAAHGLDPAAAHDRQALAQALEEPAAIEQRIERLESQELKDLVVRLIRSQGGIGERRYLERTGLVVGDPGRFGEALEAALLGTVLGVDLADAGLALGPGSIVIFPEIASALLEARADVAVPEEPEPPADVLAELAALRAFIDHHAVKKTREGTLYRATARKIAAKVLAPGSRPYDEEAAIDQLIRFVEERHFVQIDAQGRLRAHAAWSAFESADAVARTDELLNFVRNDLSGVRGAIHAARLRRVALVLLEGRGRARWTDLKTLALLARNRSLTGLDFAALSDRFQRRYRHEAAPELASPGVLASELGTWLSGPLAWTGLVEIARTDGQPSAIRLSRLGALVLAGEAPTDAAPVRKGALIATADFEVVVFPEIGSVTLVQEIARFARRRKADVSVHFRIDADSIHHAVAQGLAADDILGLLEREGRHAVPSNVATQIRSWASEVRVLAVRRHWLLRGESEAAIDAALQIPEVRAVAGERLNPLTVELLEDPANPRIASPLRAQGFYLR